MRHDSPLFAFALAATAAIAPSSVFAQQGARAHLTVEWFPETPEHGIHVPAFLVAAHDGEFDFYDHARPVPEALEPVFQQLGAMGALNVLHPPISGLEGNAVFGSMYHVPYGVVGFLPRPGQPRDRIATLEVRPDEHRYFSYLAAVRPSDDAFVGNEEPRQVQLFDEQGRFKGPVSIELFGSQVFDAGLCENDEADVRLLDGTLVEPCDGGEGTAQPHPGLNGSLRNPDGVPQRILGATADMGGTQLHYDPEAADFTVPGYRLGRLVIRETQAPRWHVAGSWYDPERAGEGFNIELLPPGQPGHVPRILVYWYTYAPDGSGEPVWLSGMAHAYANEVSVPLHVSEGGVFASRDNPALVERTPWGQVTLTFTSCTTGSITWTAEDANWPSGGYDIHRLGPVPPSAVDVCAAVTP